MGVLFMQAETHVAGEHRRLTLTAEGVGFAEATLLLVSELLDLGANAEYLVGALSEWFEAFGANRLPINVSIGEDRFQWEP